MEIPLEDIIEQIGQADDLELNEIITAIRKRYAALFPDWEVLFLSLPKNDPAARRRTLDLLHKYT